MVSTSTLSNTAELCPIINCATSAQVGATPAHSQTSYTLTPTHAPGQFHGSGQFGDVKKAKWNDKVVAVKCFTSADRKGGFQEEVSLLAGRLIHLTFHVSQLPTVTLYSQYII